MQPLWGCLMGDANPFFSTDMQPLRGCERRVKRILIRTQSKKKNSGVIRHRTTPEKRLRDNHSTITFLPLTM